MHSIIGHKMLGQAKKTYTHMFGISIKYSMFRMHSHSATTTKVVYKAYLHSIMSYIIFWHNSTGKYKTFFSQKCVIRIISNSFYIKPSYLLFNDICYQ